MCGSRRGFSLLELLITLIIIAVLIVIAIPSYEHLTMNIHRIDGKIGLLQLAAQLEKSSPEKIEKIQISPQRFYKLVILERNSENYLLAAYPLKSQRKDKKCPILAYDSQGQKGLLQGNKIIIDKYCWE